MHIIQSILENLPLIIIGVVAIGLIIGFHELGHFTFCKLFKVKTPSFSIGFGPKLISRQIGDTLFSISAIPFGGYVEIAGIEEVGQGDQKEAGRRDELSFSAKPYYQKLLILSGGILFNILMAYIIMTILFNLGAPKTPLLGDETIPAVVGRVIPGLAAEKHGLQINDKIKAINDKAINSSTELHLTVKDLANQPANLLIERNGQTINQPITIGTVKQGSKEIGQIGIEFASCFAAPLPIGKSIVKAFHATWEMLVRTASQYGSLFKNRAYQAVGGPIMMISEVCKSAKNGFKSFLLLLVIINISLAVLNLIPIPILDGGQILFTTIEAIIRRPIPDSIRLGIHYVCWFAAIGLTIYLSYQDLLKLLSSLLNK